MAQSLISMPPELLLTIISHLPSSSSLYALSQTSHYLASFLHTHAPTICNTHIQKHYSTAASILQSSYLDGWLVPKHHCIAEGEERWRRELAIHTNLVSSQQQSNIILDNCCFRSHTPDSRAPRPYQTTISPLSTPHRPTPTHYHDDLSLSLSLGLPLKLSRPGPHYLTFLEKYNMEINIRWDMNVARREEGDTTSDHFDWIISRYCVRPWLISCQETFIDGLPVSDFPGRRKVSSKKMIVKLKDKICEAVRKGRNGFKGLREKMSRDDEHVRDTHTPQRLLFGEITESESDDLDEKHSTGGSFVLETDCWVKGLLWYYGVSGQLASVARSERLDTPPRSQTQTSKLNAYTTTMKQNLQQRLRGVEHKLEKAWKGLRCRQRFEPLED